MGLDVIGDGVDTCGNNVLLVIDWERPYQNILGDARSAVSLAVKKGVAVMVLTTSPEGDGLVGFVDGLREKGGDIRVVANTTIPDTFITEIGRFIEGKPTLKEESESRELGRSTESRG